MKKRTSLKSLILLSCALLGCFKSGLSFAVSCGDYLASDVVLSSDLHCTSGYTAFEVAANNITIDLNGHTLSGPDSLMGISIVEYDKITIKNGTIKGFWVGVNTARSNRLIVDNVTFFETGAGVIVSAGNNALIRDNDFINLNGQGVALYVWDEAHSANENTIINNEFFQVREGVSICGDQADYNTIANNLIWKAQDNGIHLNRSDRNQIYQNRILDMIDGDAIRLNNSSYNEFNNNSLQQGSRSGVSILADAGSACLDTGWNRSAKNRLIENRIMNYQSAVSMGLGISSVANVEGNGLLNNQLTNNMLGIFFNTDTKSNYARGNNFSGTPRAVLDHGTRNWY